MVPFPRHRLAALEDLGARVLERHGATGPPEALARDLLAGFVELCLRLGLDGVLVELERAFAPLSIDDETDLSEEPRLLEPLAARLSNREHFDPRGPRAPMPRRLADCLAASLSIGPHDVPDRTITLSDAVRGQLVAALSSAVEAPLAAPQLRTAIIAAGRARCEPDYLYAFARIAPQLRGSDAHLPPQPTTPIHVVQAVQRALFAARTAVLERAAHDAIDRAARVLARASADAAARIDQPITHQLTPRDVAVRRLDEVRRAKPDLVVQSLLASLSELADLAWEAPERTARAYSPRESFAVGDLIDHPTFGRGAVHATAERTMEIEFEDGSWRTLAHGRPR